MLATYKVRAMQVSARYRRIAVVRRYLVRDNCVDETGCRQGLSIAYTHRTNHWPKTQKVDISMAL